MEAKQVKFKNLILDRIDIDNRDWKGLVEEAND